MKQDLILALIPVILEAIRANFAGGSDGVEKRDIALRRIEAHPLAAGVSREAIGAAVDRGVLWNNTFGSWDDEFGSHFERKG